MASVTFDGVGKIYPGRHHGGARPEPRDRGRGVHGARRAVGLRQDDGAADGRRPRGDHARACCASATASSTTCRRATATSRWCSRATRSTRTCRVYENIAFGLQGQEDAEGRDRPARAGGRARPRPRAVPRAQAARALRRPAPARRDGPRDRARAGGVPDGRAAVEPRREAARADARRDRAAAARPRRRRRSTSRTTRSRR